MSDVIVVGVDTGEPALRAGQRAAELAVALGCRLHVVTALERGTVEEFPDRPGSTLLTSGEVAEAAVNDVARELAERVPAIRDQIATSVVHDKPASALVEEARRLDARLVVIGNRRTQGVARVLGSVAGAVVAHAPCDVHIVKTV